MEYKNKTSIFAGDYRLINTQRQDKSLSLFMEIKEKKNKGKKMKRWHKWGGLIFSFFFILFALSGIFLNHRKEISGLEINRSWLPSSYHYNKWNNGAVKGTLKLSPDSILMYGGAGVFLTDSLMNSVNLYNKGIKEGADNQIVGNIAKTTNGSLFAVTTFDLYSLDREDDKWNNMSGLLDTDERLSDIQSKGDTLVVLSRSHLFVATPPYKQFTKIELKAPYGYKKKATLFRTMWTLHSGELFHLPGKLFVDLLGVVSIILCVTGIIITFFPKIMKRRKKAKAETKRLGNVLKKSFKLHNKLGLSLLIFLIALVLSGMFLRPPLLIAIIRSKVATIPGTILHSENPWFDKLRCIRYDDSANEWMFYSSEGFYGMSDFDVQPKELRYSPPVSVMGVNVLEKHESGVWIVGSFSGLFYWSKETGNSIDAYTMMPAMVKRGGPPTFTNAVAGYSADLMGVPVAFDYTVGAKPLKRSAIDMEMPDYITRNSKMSLWHLCLEIHVGRIYSPIIGMFSDVFVFLAGLMGLSILITGYFMIRRRQKKQKPASNP